jgi:hypothetical protein
MPNIEILAYSPIDLQQFIGFCIKGKPIEGTNDFEKDEIGRDIRGVMSWLHGREVPKAQFFHTGNDLRMPFFMALVQKRDDEPVPRPWFKTIRTSPPRLILNPDIPGVDKVLNVDGQLGMLQDFLPISELLAKIEHRPELDDEFAAQRERVLEVLKGLEEDPDRRMRFLAALRSDRGSNPTELFEELKFSLRG